MPLYNYVARNKSGKRVSDVLTALDENDLAQKLAHSGFVLISSSEEKLGRGKGNIKLTPTQVLDFTINLTSLLKGGLRLLDALNALSQDAKDKQVAVLVMGLRDHVEAGGTFKSALSLSPKTFSKFYISMVEAGEKTGKLNSVLEEVSGYLEWQLDLRAKIKELTTYPLIILAVMVIVVSILVGWVLPKFEPILKELGTELPLPTKIVLGASHFFSRYFLLIFICIILMIIGMKLLLRNKKARFYYDRMILKAPLFGGLLQKLCLVRFCQSMSLGLASGMGIIENLDLSKEVSGNLVFEKGIKTVKDSVATGGLMSVAFALTGVFPSMVVRMVEVGERSGSLGEGFSRISEYYNKEVLRMIKKIFTLLEPILIVFMGVVVGGIALSVFLPLVKMTQAIG